MGKKWVSMLSFLLLWKGFLEERFSVFLRGSASEFPQFISGSLFHEFIPFIKSILSPALTYFILVSVSSIVPEE